MNKSTFFDIVKHPNQLDEATLPQLIDIVDEFPWFQAARILLVKNMHQIDHVRYNSELKLAASHIPDRAKLFELIHYPRNTQEEVVQESASQIIATTGKPEVDSEKREIPEKRAQEEASKTISNITSTSEYFQVDDVIDTAEGSSINFSMTNADSEQSDEVDNMVLPSADLLGFDVHETTGYQLKEARSLEEHIEENRSFSDWLEVLKHAPKTEESSSEKPIQKEMQLIDSFLNLKQPRIAPKKKASFMADKPEVVTKIAQKSESEGDDLMSDTLASIYIKQKHYTKAISIYEKLSLKYPEKIVYFADQISELEKLINNQ